MLQYCEKKILIIIMVYHVHIWQYIAVTSSSLCARSLVGDLEFYVGLEYFLLSLLPIPAWLLATYVHVCIYGYLLMLPVTCMCFLHVAFTKRVR